MATAKTQPNTADEQTPAERVTPEDVPVHVALNRVAQDIGAIAKNLKNVDAGYAARSIDDVLDKVHDPLTRHGIVLLPEVIEANYEIIEVGRNRTPMREATLKIRWRFIGPQGDSLDVVTCGEALDSGDKATNKAQSASLKYALLHTFTIPLKSGDTEADETSPERSARADGPSQQQGGVYASKEDVDTIVAKAKELKDAGGDPGKWPVVLGVKVLEGRKCVLTHDEAVALTSRLVGEITKASQPVGSHCTNCGHVIDDNNAALFYDDNNEHVTACAACSTVPDDASSVTQ